MTKLFVDCPNGISGDMLMAAMFDLGVPREVIENPLSSLGLGKSFSLKIKEERSFGIRGLQISVDTLEENPPARTWKNIKEVINNASWNDSLRTKVLDVFKLIAEAEANVHGTSSEEVHFHEIGAIDSLVDVIGVCAAVEYLRPEQILCSIPPAGYGTVKTSHGLLPVPVPAVLEIAKIKGVELSGEENVPEGELTTPTGFALMAILSDSFGKPASFGITSIGVGLGHRKLDRPNLLRIIQINNSQSGERQEFTNAMHWERLVIQEAWIDDSTPEDISSLVEQLKIAGAIEVVCHPVQMKKGRQGILVSAIVSPENSCDLRLTWFSKGTTLGLRERIDGRWVLPRRCGYSSTSFGKISMKQVKRIDGRLTIKAEHDDIIRISKELGKSIDEVRREVDLGAYEFIPSEEWTWGISS